MRTCACMHPAASGTSRISPSTSGFLRPVSCHGPAWFSVVSSTTSRAVVNGERLEAVEMLLWIWTFVIVVFFTLSTFKLDHYVFPAAPALCLLCARAWFDLRNARLSPRHAGARVGLQLVGPLVVAMGIACGYLLVVRLELPAHAMAVPVTPTVVGVAFTVLANLRGRLLPRTPWIPLVGLFVTYVCVVAWVMPALDRRKVVDDIGRWSGGASASRCPIAARCELSFQELQFPLLRRSAR